MFKLINFMTFYQSRQGRANWITSRFKDVFHASSSVLDVGCWEKDLKTFLSEKKKYHGIDIAGTPDEHVDLEKIDRLPFKDREYDTVVCTDVLEHIENIHQITGELFRVARRNVIVTLPNPLQNIWSYVFNKKTNKGDKFGVHAKYYGLPLEIPEDRHRWFYSYDEAVCFMKHKAKEQGFTLTVLETDMDHKKVNTLPRVFARIGSLILGKRFFVSSIIFLFEYHSNDQRS